MELGEFSNDYLLLNPEKATLFDFVRILCFPSYSLKQRDFIDIQEPANLSGLLRRWLLFVSLVVQKLCIKIKTPITLIGDVIETWLNLVSSNNGVGYLLLNFLSGKVILASDPSSAKFASVNAYIDTRVKLDEQIKNTDVKYRPALSVMASKLSYENEAYIQNVVQNVWGEMEYLGFFNCWDDHLEKSATQAMMFKDTSTTPNTIVIAFRGTSPFDTDDWRADVDFSWFDLNGLGKVHGGFMKALGLQKGTGWPKEIPMGPTDKHYAYYDIRQKLRDLLKENDTSKFIVTGHSLGGALAILFAGILMFHEENDLLKRLDGVYTFGQPRVGDKKFGEYMVTNMFKYNVGYFRFVYCNDVVPRMPYDGKTLLFKHFGRCLYFNSWYEGEILAEEPNKNYFSPLWTLPMAFNAIWELIRSFLLPLTMGEEYEESWLCRFLRSIAILFPGLADHSLQDYDNVTRLGTLQLLQHTDKDD
ncbi:triacylglycerol lipase OBL1-like [Impatiens glandulifera]|uniref:triacylglycerol lipase OBL1-like n=1 Tax=Impatiens glandulifera TaxID=253017 RepID=UPI001FB0CB97|nr:triacylglycerol lipase OBL1-like [Impatiens glandulifera]